jgi:hypothetical protein
MVRAFLTTEFGIEDTSVRRYEPKDFVVQFANRDDAERVLHSQVLNPPFRLIWHPWSRLSTASSTFLRYHVLVGMTRVPLHARSATVAQTILGRACARIEIAPPEAVPVDDDKEFFVSAWCMDPQFVLDEQIIFIHEPVHWIPGTALCLHADDEVIDGLPGLNYLVRIRIVEFQDDDIFFVDRRGVDLQDYTASLDDVDLSCMDCGPSAPITQDPSASLVSIDGHRAADPQYVFAGSLVDIDLSCLECCLPAPTNLNLEHMTSVETTACHAPRSTQRRRRRHHIPPRRASSQTQALSRLTACWLATSLRAWLPWAWGT